MQKNKKYNIKSILVQNQRLSFKDKLFFQELEGFIRPLRMTKKIKRLSLHPKQKNMTNFIAREEDINSLMQTCFKQGLKTRLKIK